MLKIIRFGYLHLQITFFCAVKWHFICGEIVAQWYLFAV